MAKHIILAQSKVTAAALNAFLGIAKAQYRQGEEGDAPADIGDSSRKAEQVIWGDPTVDLEAYRFLADEIETRVSGADDHIPVGEVVVLVDQVDLARLDPIGSNGWDGVIAMLILTFPEIRWIFGVVKESTEADVKSLVRDHGLLSLFEAWNDPLFDGTGLREWVHSRARKPEGDPSPDAAKHLPKRKKIAVAIDEERNYAYVHGYVAYRFGFRAYTVTEEAQMEQLLGENGLLKDSADFQVSIEDLCLNFPDRSDKHRETHWSDLEQRSEKLPVLDQADVMRVFVTSGQDKGMEKDRRERNRAFRDNLRDEGRLGKILYKPIAGIFDLWTSAGLMKELKDGRQRGQAEGFIWPPDSDGDIASSLNHDHSAPGRLLEVATRLEARAERLLKDAHCAVRAVQAAVLAVEATELLGEKAQTTFLEALALKHEFEAIAECQFYGIQSHFDVASRMKDIRFEVHELGRYFNPERRKESEWNAEASMLNRLIYTYKKYNQFDEELDIQARSRAVHRRLWFKKRMYFAGDSLRWINPAYWAACYVHALLKSIPVFLLALLLWIGGLSVLYSITSQDGPSGTLERLHRGAEGAVTSFFSVGGPIRHGETPTKPAPDVALPKASAIDETNKIKQLDERLSRLETETAAAFPSNADKSKTPRYVAVICLAILAGFVHVGIFISHLYAIISRK